MECAAKLTSNPQFLCKVEEKSIWNRKDAVTDDPLKFAIEPIKTLKEALNWEPKRSDLVNVAVTKLRSVTRTNDAPKTLVCHDMKGGYLEDRLPQGCILSPCYNFLHWDHIDSFIYFSHSFLTIPPPCWTNAAHLHGVKCLGTLITEWKDGALICEEFLKDKDSYLKLVDQMVSITKFYNFDGWLVNIENTVKADHAPRLVEFVAQLTKEMKLARPESEIIWYDSVTEKGDLKWQDELNTLNMRFFEVCDGMFLNYTWTKEKLKSSAFAAKGRLHDVYVGVDVFGRGCYGGGGFETYKALEVAREVGLSVAIFAPGWVFECLNVENFSGNQIKFWKSLLPYLYEHHLHALPLVTNFCQGEGKKFFIDGIACSDMPWTNISFQSLQPCFLTRTGTLSASDDGGYVQSIFNSEIGFNGGGCLELSGQFSTMQREGTIDCDIVHCDVLLDCPIHVSLTVQKQYGIFDYFLLLHFIEAKHTVALAPLSQADLHKEKKGIDKCLATFHKTIYSLSEPSNVVVLPQKEAKTGQNSPFCEQSQWLTHVFKVDSKSCQGRTLTKVSILLKATVDDDIPFSLCVGELKLLKDEDVNVCFPVISSFICEDVITLCKEEKNCMSVHFTLSWVLEGCCDLVNFFDIYHLKGSSENRVVSFIGRAYSTTFRISSLDVHPENIVILIQPVSYGKVRLGVEKCPCVTIILDCISHLPAIR